VGCTTSEGVGVVPSPSDIVVVGLVGGGECVWVHLSLNLPRPVSHFVALQAVDSSKSNQLGGLVTASSWGAWGSGLGFHL